MRYPSSLVYRFVVYVVVDVVVLFMFASYLSTYCKSRKLNQGEDICIQRDGYL